MIFLNDSQRQKVVLKLCVGTLTNLFTNKYNYMKLRTNKYNYPKLHTNKYKYPKLSK